MGHVGFSYIGAIFLCLLFVPNLVWAKQQPKGYTSTQEAKGLVVCERLGQVSTTACCLIFTDFNLRPFSLWSLWLVAAFLLMLLYEGWWLRYFHSSQTLSDFYSSYGGVPLAGATLPVAAFFLLGMYGKVWWLMLSSILLGIGHIGIHIQHKKDIT